MTVQIAVVGADTEPDEMYGLLDGAGCLVERDMADTTATDAVREELSEHMTAVRVEDDDPTSFLLSQRT